MLEYRCVSGLYNDNRDVGVVVGDALNINEQVGDVNAQLGLAQALIRLFAVYSSRSHEYSRHLPIYK